ncbi:MAG: FAD binding domain-containing protein [Peptostreptococcaceae bacterium]
MFDVYKSNSLEEVLDILYDKEKSKKVIAGGTDLIIDIKNNRFNKDILIDISDIKELKFIKDTESKVQIGACTTFNDLINSDILNDNLYVLKKASSLVGSPQIRSRATVGGNICNNSPSADIIPPLLALDAKVCIRSKENTRFEYLKNILIDKNKIALDSDEIITYIEFDKLNNNQKLSFSKLGYRNSLSIAKLSCALLVEIEDNKFKNINMALGALNKIALREYEVEKFLIGKEVSESNIESCLELMENIISERLKSRPSCDFKSKAIRGILKEAIYGGIF